MRAAVLCLGLVLSGCASPATTAKVGAPEAAAIGDVVCTEDGATLPASTATLLRRTVLHGGACGACSTHRDVAVYWRTRRTLTAQATGCAFGFLVGGAASTEACLREIGFSPGCATCWQQNIACTASQCREVCLRSRLTGQRNGVVDDDGRVELDPCIACDEVRCGPAFVACAGATRRRAGIDSDIPRPATQVWRSTWRADR